MIAIDVTDPLAEKLNDIEDVYTHMPGLVEATHDWFRTYKMPGSDNPPNEFAFQGKAKNKVRKCSMDDTHSIYNLPHMAAWIDLLPLGTVEYPRSEINLCNFTHISRTMLNFC